MVGRLSKSTSFCSEYCFAYFCRSAASGSKTPTICTSCRACAARRNPETCPCTSPAMASRSGVSGRVSCACPVISEAAMVKKPTTIRNGGAVITRGVYTRLSPNRKTYLLAGIGGADRDRRRRKRPLLPAAEQSEGPQARFGKVHPKKTGRGPGRRDNLQTAPTEDRKSTRLNSSHQIISYAVFCLKKNNIGGHSPQCRGSSSSRRAPPSASPAPLNPSHVTPDSPAPPRPRNRPPPTEHPPAHYDNH